MYEQFNNGIDAQEPAEIDSQNGQNRVNTVVKNYANIDAMSNPGASQKPVERTTVPAAKVFDAPALKRLESALKSAPLPAKKMGKSEALVQLLPELKKQLDRGHTAASLAAVLGDGGMRISERKLAQVLRQQGAISAT